MITFLHKPLKELKIGVLGLRSEILAEILTQRGVPFETLASDADITAEFDFVFCSGYYYMIPQANLDKVRYGVYVFHETPLPEGKGHAPLQWTVLNGRKNITVTGFKCVAKPDGGEILYQYNVEVDPMDTLPILEQKRHYGAKRCFEQAIDELLTGVLVLRAQSGKGSYHKKRGPEDSKLDADKPLKELWDNIRICDNEKFPAFFYVGDKKVILRYEVIQ